MKDNRKRFSNRTGSIRSRSKGYFLEGFIRWMILRMLINDRAIEQSIKSAKMSALERQPIRHDIYLQHIEYLEAKIEKYRKALIRNGSIHINHNFKTSSIKAEEP